MKTFISPPDIQAEAEDVAFEEIEFGIIPEAEGDVEEEDVELEEGIHKLTTPEECEELSRSTWCIALVQQLLLLASYAKITCPVCSEDWAESSFTGSAMYIKWVSCQ